MAAESGRHLAVLVGHHRQRPAWTGTAGGMPDGSARWPCGQRALPRGLGRCAPDAGPPP